jgi:hypothetical protein
MEEHGAEKWHDEHLNPDLAFNLFQPIGHHSVALNQKNVI